MTVNPGVDIETDGLLRLALALLQSAFDDEDWAFLRSKACDQLVDFITEELGRVGLETEEFKAFRKVFPKLVAFSIAEAPDTEFSDYVVTLFGQAFKEVFAGLKKSEEDE